MANEKQLALASRLDLDVTDDSEAVAAARIEDCVQELLGNDVRQVTTGMLKKGCEMGLNLLGESFAVAYARIADAIRASNLERLEKLQLKVGDHVVVVANGPFPRRTGVVREILPDGVVRVADSAASKKAKGKKAPGAYIEHPTPSRSKRSA